MVVGNLQRLVNVRPDVAFAVKTLARETSNITPDSWCKAKHLLRYLQGTSDLHFAAKPDVALQASDKHELRIFSGPDWAGGLQTRNSTSGFIIQYCGATISFGSRTQENVATSSYGAELYGMGASTAEALHFQRLLAEARLAAKEPTLILHTDA
eukprot:10117292-Alexandrium_andersonii.AAC.1